MNNIKVDIYDYTFKIVLIGDSGVGKSQILSRLKSEEFQIETKTTIGVEFGTIDFILENKNVKLQIWDTAGQERFRSLAPSYYRGAEGVVIIYDITNYISFKNISHWIEECKKHLESNDIPIILLGNKVDLIEKRCISIDEAKNFAEKNNLLFFETSAKENNNIESIFHNLTKYILNQAVEYEKENNSDKNYFAEIPSIPLSEIKNNNYKCVSIKYCK